MTIRNSRKCFFNGVAVKSLAILGFVTMFTACGDDALDDISSTMQDGIEIVSEENDLPDCTKDNDGELMFIRSGSSLRVCSDKKWRAVTQNSDGSINFSCSTESLADSSGLKIICGGDSIGVVLNGVNGINGKNGEAVNGTNGQNGASCTAVELADKSGMKIVCGVDSVGVVYNGKNGTNGTNGSNGINGENGSSCELMQLDESSLRFDCGEKSATIQLNDAFKIMAITNKTITGVAQKGPFLKGSSVVLYELDGNTLSSTGKTYKGKVTGDKGEFSIPNVSLVSQYALVEVEGYYRNEKTGDKSSNSITLSSLVDLSNRSKVNINVVTHLEQERVLTLIEKGLKFNVAKKQAESEIFEAFGFTENFEAAEDLDIFKTGAGNTALLVISVMILGDYGKNDDLYFSESNLLERLTNIAFDLKSDGAWNDEKMKTEIADAVYANYCYGYDESYCKSANPSDIRANIESWGLMENIPDFEKYMDQFRWNLYGLGICSTENDGELGKNENSLSKNVNRMFACGNLKWRIATSDEIYAYDTYGWSAGQVGEAKWGNVTDRCYTWQGDAWYMSIHNEDCSLGIGACNTSRAGTILQGSDDKWYICNSWLYYWSSASELDLALGECRESTEGVVRQIASDEWYTCRNNKWTNSTDYEKDTYGWTAG